MPWISFDLDGTLAEWPYGKAVISKFRAAFDHPEAGAAVQREFRRRLSSDRPADAFEWDDIHEVARLELGFGELPLLGDLAASATFDPGLVYPDTGLALARMRAAGWRVAVGTNGLARYQQVALGALGLEYEALLTPDTTGFVKPQAGFLEALPRLSGDPGATNGLVHVGDLLAQDILAANRAGARAVWVWRAMPEHWRAVPPLSRAGHPDMRATLEEEFPAEIERDGRMGEFYDRAFPAPDLIVADLLELSGALAEA